MPFFLKFFRLQFLYLLKGFYCVLILGLHLWHMDVPRLGVESELHLLAYSHSSAGTEQCLHLHPSSGQRRILNPLSEARDLTHILMDTSWAHYH